MAPANPSTRSASGSGARGRASDEPVAPLDGLNSRGLILSSGEEPEIVCHGSGLDDWLQKLFT